MLLSGPAHNVISAGIGRTGVYIVLEIALLLLSNRRDADLPRVLEHVRAQRIGLVQTEVGGVHHLRPNRTLNLIKFISVHHIIKNYFI